VRTWSWPRLAWALAEGLARVVEEDFFLKSVECDYLNVVVTINSGEKFLSDIGEFLDIKLHSSKISLCVSHVP